VEHHPTPVTPEADGIAWFSRVFAAAEAEIGRVVLGQEDAIARVLVALVVGGHGACSSRPT
jgi:hypothetical protein